MTQTQQQPQIIYKQATEKNLISEYQTTLSLYKKYKLDPLDKACHGWLAASIGCILLPIALASWKQATPPLRALNFVLSGLGLGSAVMAKSSASAYMKADRKYFSNESFLESLEQEDRDAQFGAFQLALQAELDARLPQKPEQQVVRTNASVHPEWIEEKVRIQEEFKQLGVPVSVQSKEIAGQKIIYVIRPTPGVSIKELLREGKQAEITMHLLVNAGLPNAKIKAVLGRILLIVDNPHAPMLMDIRAAEPQYVPAPVGRQGQEQQHDRTHDQPPVQSNTVQPAPPFTQQHQPQPQPPSGLPRISNVPIVEQLPDGVDGVTIEELGNVNRYPVVMLCADQGAGKTATVMGIFQRLDGFKVVASPKPLTEPVVQMADLVFGYNVRSCQWLNFGSMNDSNFDDRADLSWHLHQVEDTGKIRGSMLDFLWGCRRESMNRQSGATEGIEHWRAFYDEAAYTYLSGYNDPLSPDGKAEKAAQALISGVLKDAFMNFRGQRVQLWIGTQNESVDSIGLKNFSAAIKIAWHLYPGLNAITAAEKYGKPQLAHWFRQQIAQGKGIALLEKDGVFFEVITNLPSIDELKRLSEGSRFELSQPGRTESPEIADYDDRFEERLGFDPDDADRLDGTDPYQAILDWVSRNHPDRVNDKAFPDDVTLNFLWCKWFQQNDKTIQPLNHKGLAELRNILNQKRGG